MKLFADSGCDLPKTFFEQHHVELIPLRVNLNGAEYEDVIGIEPTEVYHAIRQSNVHPKTSQVSPEAFFQQFEALAKSDEEGLYIAMSSGLSGTYNTAVMIAEQVKEYYPDVKLTIIDTKCVSLGQGLLVKHAVTLRDEGASFDEIVQSIKKMALHMEHYFTVEDLNYLAQGGRISKTSAFLGGLLSVKPILKVGDGKLLPLEKIRGRKKAIARILDIIKEQGSHFTDQIIGISHGDDLAFSEDIKAMIEERFKPQQVLISMVGSVIGAHTGPGVIAIFFLNKEYFTD